MPPPASPTLEPEPIPQEQLSGIPHEHSGRYVPTKGSIPVELGRGGLGRVVAYRDTVLGRDVARKELIRKNNLASFRFLREARITAQLEHPNIIPIYELGCGKNGELYYTMKRARGRTLATAIAEAGKLDTRLLLLGHFVDLCQAIAYAHAQGVIHRDIKPHNIMLGEFGETIVLDWGLARIIHDTPHTSDLIEQIVHFERNQTDYSADGSIIGTPAYMSPEQARGALHALNAQSDIWSLGVVLYEILTGSPPFTGNIPIDVVHKVTHDPLPPVLTVCPDAPRELAAIAERALQKDPAQRYLRAQDLASDIEAWQNGRRVSAHQYSMVELIRLFAGRNKIALTVGGVGLISLLIMSVLYTHRLLREQAFALHQVALVNEARAVATLNDNIPIEATRYALTALRMEERPEARGVVLTALGRWIPALIERAQIARKKTWPEINTLRWSTDGRIGISSIYGFFLWNHKIDPIDERAEAVAVHFDGPHPHWLSIDGRLFTHNQGVLEEKWKSPGVKAAVFSPNGDIWIATNTGLEHRAADGTLRWRAPNLLFTAITLSQDLSTLAVTDPSGQVQFWDAQRGQPILGLTISASGAMQFSPDGRWFAATDAYSADRDIHIWDLQTGQKVFQLRGHLLHVSALAFSADGTLLISGSADKRVALWDLTKGTMLSCRTAHQSKVTAITIAPDNKQFATADASGNLLIWAFPDRLRPIDGHIGFRTPAAASSGDGRLLWVAGALGQTRLIDTVTGQTIEDITREGRAMVSIDDSGQMLAWTTGNGGIQVIDRFDRSWVRRIATPRGHPVLSLYTPPLPATERWLAVLSEPSKKEGQSSEQPPLLQLWDLQSSNPTKIWEQPLVERGHRISFSPDGQWVAVLSGDFLELRETRSGARAFTHQGISGQGMVVWSADSQLLFFPDQDYSVYTLQISDFSISAPPLVGHTDAISSGCMLGDDLLVTASRDTTLRVWDLATHVERARLLGHHASPIQIGCQQDRQQIISVTTDGELRTWNIENIRTPATQLPALQERWGLMEEYSVENPN